MTLFALTNPELVTIKDVHCAVNEAGKLMRRSDGRLASVVTAVDNESFGSFGASHRCSELSSLLHPHQTARTCRWRAVK